VVFCGHRQRALDAELAKLRAMPHFLVPWSNELWTASRLAEITDVRATNDCVVRSCVLDKIAYVPPHRVAFWKRAISANCQ
jgi:hypothetical protein